MAGMSGRFSTVIKSKINKLLDKAEDPSETLEYSYQKQMELLQNVKKGIADVVTSKKRLQLQQQKLEQQVVKLDTQARQALAQNREDLGQRNSLEARSQLAEVWLRPGGDGFGTHVPILRWRIWKRLRQTQRHHRNANCRAY